MDAPIAIPRRTETIRAFKQGGGRIAAALPIHYPRALFRAFGFLPVEVWGPPRVDASLGAAHLQSYVCSIVRNALAFIQAGGLCDVDLILVPHACDSLQGLGSLLLDFVPPAQPVVPLYLPRGTRECDLAFLADELRSVYQRLQEVTGISPSDAEIMHCIRAEEDADRLLGKLHRGRARLLLSQIDLYRLIRSREYLPAEEFADLAQSALALSGDRACSGTPILLSGIVPEPMTLFESIAAMGGVVAADDLACCGRRLYPAGESDDPFRRMAESLLHGPPDPMRGSPIQQRLDHLLALCQTSGVRGVVFYEVKFCEPELFDLPDLRKGLLDSGLPSVVIEVDLNEPLSQQTLTRIEAFLEMIS